MKRMIFLILILIFNFSCSKKKNEELTPLNAPAKYGETMGRAMKKAKGMNEVLYLKDKINMFQVQEGRYPNSLNELVEKGYIDKLPEPPEGMKFVYDPKTGNIDVR
jgi:hypothetical protein